MTGLSGSILITGGTGTLGKALVQTAEREGWPCRFTIYSRSEHRQVQMRAQHPHCCYVLGDVRDYERLHAAMAGHDMVIHAAALKHVDLGDVQPDECAAINIQGSANVIRAAQAHAIKRCLSISTDKAARAVTAYGASKLVMEKLFQSAPDDPTVFTCVRYGNVIASNGSVLTVWKAMLERDGYVTATDPDMTRFWLTIRQAIDLIVFALSAPTGTVTIPQLPALSMRDMAKYVLPDAEFRYAGLRTNEKRHEDLLTPEEARSAEVIKTDLPWSVYRLWPSHTARGEGGLGYSSAQPQHWLTRDELLGMLA